MNSLTSHVGLASALAIELCKRASRAPAEVQPALLDRMTLWNKRRQHLLQPIVTPDGSQQATEDLLKEYAKAGHTHRVARPAGIVTLTFDGDLLAVPPHLENLERVKAVRLIFAQAPGGCGGVAQTIIYRLKAAGIPVSGHVTGFACSAHADLLVLGCHRRTMTADAKLMVHSSRTVVFGTPSALRKKADELQASNQRIAADYAARLGRDVSALFDGQDHYFDAPTALEHGLIDSISAG